MIHQPELTRLNVLVAMVRGNLLLAILILVLVVTGQEGQKSNN